MGGTYSFLGERCQAAQCGQRALDEANRAEDDTALGMASAFMGLEAMFTGHYQQNIAYSRQAIPLLESTEEYFWLSIACQISVTGYYFTGDFVRALESNGAAISPERRRSRTGC